MIPQRAILWNVPPAVVDGLYVLSALSVGWVLFWFGRRYRLWSRGGPALDQLGWRSGLVRLGVYLLRQRKIAEDRYAGWMHRLVFWGFVALFVATTLVAVQHHFHLVFLTGTTYLLFSLGADLGGLAFCIGIGMALWRRRNRASYGRLLPAASTTLTLWLLLLIGVTGFFLEAARISRDFPPF